MLELITAALAIPEIRSLIEEIALEVVHDVLTRRAVDPVYASHLDAAMAAKKAATTSEDLLAAQIKIRALMAVAQ